MNTILKGYMHMPISFMCNFLVKLNVFACLLQLLNDLKCFIVLSTEHKIINLNRSIIIT